MKTNYSKSRMLTTFRFAVLFIFVFASTASWAQFEIIAGWQFGTPATVGNEAEAYATTYNSHLMQPVLRRGNGILTYNLARGFSSINWGVPDSYDEAVKAGNYYEFSLRSEYHYAVSITTIRARLRRSTNGPKIYQWAYNLNNAGFKPIGIPSALNEVVDEGGYTPNLCSMVPELQNMEIDLKNDPLVLRLYAWSAEEETGTFAFGRTPEGTNNNCLDIVGIVTKSTLLSKGDISTMKIDNVKATTANAYCEITDIGNPRAPHYGVCWGETSMPTYENNFKLDFGEALTTNDYLATMDNLKPNTTYYARAYILNSVDVDYGTPVSFTTKPASTITAKDIAITFAGSGDASTVGSVLVENISTGMSKTISGDAVLYLNPSGTPPASTSIVDIDGNDISTMRVYPNPATYASTLSFGMAEAGNVIVNICDISGKAVSNFATNLTAGTYKFKLPALRSGIYFVTVVQNGKKQTEKLVSINNSVGSFNLIQNVEKIEIAEAKAAPQKVKAATAATDGMAFIEGNQLRFTAMSGRCKTIVMDSPSKSKNIDILFKECIDGDNNAYPIVKIGTLYWMAENLKTTKKANGTPLAKVTGAAWANLTSTSDAYCYFGDQDANAANFGALYTHHAAKTDLAPLGGWRLPTKKEFTTMAGYLDGKENAGAKLKKAETTKWTIDNRFATNLSGFSATASGLKVGSAFSATGKEAAFWNSDETKPTEASFAKLTSALDSICLYGDTLRAAGLSVRYVFEAEDTRPKQMADVFGADKNLGVDYSKNLPLQNNTVLMAPDKELFFTGRHDTSLSPQLRFMDNPTASSAPYITGLPAIASGTVKWWENPKKATTMVNANGRESTVIAVWNEAVAGQTFGYKDITLHIIGDESVNYAHQSLVLPNKFWMPTIVSGAAYSGATMGAYDIQEAWQWEMMLRTGDVTGDGVPEILVAVHDTLRIYEYNGTSLTKIHERGFRSDFRDLNKEYAFCLRIEVADMNQDGKNDIVAMTSTPKSFLKTVDDDSYCAVLHVFKDCDLSLDDDANKHKVLRLKNGIQDPDGERNYARTANFAVGDINNDGSPEIAICFVYTTVVGTTTYKRKGLAYAKFITTENGIDPFTLTTLSFSRPCMDWLRNQSMVLAKLKGHAGPNYIIFGELIAYIDANGLLTLNKETPTSTETADFGSITKQYSTHLIYGDQIVAGNFNKNASGIEMLYYIANIRDVVTTTANVELDMYSSALNQTTNAVILNTAAVPYFKENSANLLSKNHFPVIAAVNTKHTGRVLQFMRHQYMLSKPTLIAAIAAAPYYEGFYNTSSNPMTTWSKSTSTGGATATESTHTAALIVGYEHEFTIPVIGTKIGGIEFTAKVALGFSKNYETSQTTTISVGFSGKKEDAAVVSSTPYDVFYYKILKSEKPEEVNTELMFAFPRKLETMVVSVDDYNRLVEGQNAPKIDKDIFRHKAGDPFSYPTAAVPAELKLSNLYWGGNLEYESPYVGVGLTGESKQSIGVEKTKTETNGFNFECEAELIGTIGGFKAGASYGYSNSTKLSTTIGSCTQVEGTVPSVTDQTKTYSWALKWYNFQKSGYKFQVVNYLVSK